MKRSASPEVEVQITPMLDMAFQLLTFFILTYRPAPSEGQFSMNLLPPQAATKFDAPITNESTADSGDVPAALRTMTVSLRAGSGGRLYRMSLGDNEIPGMDELRTRLAEIKADPTLPFDQALIQVDPDLKYEELMRVIDVFSSLDFKKISFAELGADGAEPRL